MENKRESVNVLEELRAQDENESMELDNDVMDQLEEIGEN